MVWAGGHAVCSTARTARGAAHLRDHDALQLLHVVLEAAHDGGLPAVVHLPVQLERPLVEHRQEVVGAHEVREERARDLDALAADHEVERHELEHAWPLHLDGDVGARAAERRAVDLPEGRRRDGLGGDAREHRRRRLAELLLHTSTTAVGRLASLAARSDMPGRIAAG